MWSPFLHPSKKGLSFPLSLGKKRVYLETQLKGEFTDLFENWQGGHCSHRQSRNRMMNTFIIVKIATSLENSLENKSMLLVHFKKDLPLTLLGNSFDGKAAY